MPVRIIPLAGGPPVELVRDVTLVGRADGCDVRIDHRTLSKRHCVLAVTDGFVLVRDLESTNGVRVNGQRVRHGVLFPGDRLGLAKFQYRLAVGDPPPAADTPPAS